MLFEWKFDPDAKDIAKCKGVVMGCRSGKGWLKESTAIWYGKKWMKETGRTGKITAIPYKPRTAASYILDI